MLHVNSRPAKCSGTRTFYMKYLGSGLRELFRGPGAAWQRNSDLLGVDRGERDGGRYRVRLALDLQRNWTAGVGDALRSHQAAASALVAAFVMEGVSLILLSMYCTQRSPFFHHVCVRAILFVSEEYSQSRPRLWPITMGHVTSAKITASSSPRPASPGSSGRFSSASLRTQPGR